MTLERLAIVFAALAAVAVTVPAAVYAETIVYVDKYGRTKHVDTTDPDAWRPTPKADVHTITGTTIDFTVLYRDETENTGFGFDDPDEGAARRLIVEEVIRYVDSVLSHAGVCHIEFEESVNEGSTPLATASSYFVQTPAYHQTSAWHSIIEGSSPITDQPDILIEVDFGFNWHADLSDPPGNEHDLFTVILHEITHGLGVLSLSDQDGDSRIDDGVYTEWNRRIITGNANLCWHPTDPQFIGEPSYLIGQDNGLRLDGESSEAAFGALPPLYAPSTFSVGSSLSHFDQGIAGGSVMEPFISSGTAYRAYTDIDLAALHDLGYSVVGLNGDDDDDDDDGNGPTGPYQPPAGAPAFRVPFPER